MKKTIIFLDIDGVIFDSSKFLSVFCEKISQENNLGEETEKLERLYQEVKREEGFFDPQMFLDKISSKYLIAKEILEKSWWSEESFSKCLLIDENFFKEVRKIALIGIFSKGEINFQKKKIEKFMNFINADDVHIFEDKIIKINEILAKYNDSNIYVVDDDLRVLENFKKANRLVFTILVKKEKAITVNDNIDIAMDNVSEILPLLAGLKQNAS
jgi:hypothetical protein